jgi:hypothetical protein
MGALLPKRPRNLLLTASACLALLVAAAWMRQRMPLHPGRGFGLACGVVAALIYLLGAAHPLRKRFRRIPSLVFLQAHIYLGLFALVAVLVHSGFRWPQPGLGASLLALSVWTSLTGGLGVALQKWIPARLADGVRLEVLFERIPELREKLLAEADACTTGAGEVLTRFYRRELRLRLERAEPHWTYLLDVRSGRERALEPLRQTRGFLPPEDRERLDDLTSLLTEKLELDAHARLQGALRGWVVVHAPAAAALLGLVAFHVFAWARY